MTTNPFFNHNDKNNVDSGVYEDLIIESIQMYGLDVYYIPREIIEEDDIFNEEVLSKFGEALTIEAYPTNVDGFGGEDLLAQFGLNIKDEVTLVIARRRFDLVVQSHIPDHPMPREGDLIYYPPSGAIFEIRFVEDERPFYQLNNLPVYELQCELFTYEGQDMDTGVDDIDKIEEMYSIVHQLEITTTSGVFSDKEQVIVDGDIEAELTAVTATSMDITHVTYPTGEFKAIRSGMGITGVDSGATALINQVVDVVDNEGFGNNDKYDEVTDDVIAFTEDNPFGEL